MYNLVITLKDDMNLYFTIPNKICYLMKFKIVILLLVTSLSNAYCQILPPTLPWSGKSQAFMISADKPLATPFEKSNGKRSTNPVELESILELMDKNELIRVVHYGASPQGRPIKVVKVSTDSEFRNGKGPSKKPLALIQAGIHAGEIDGLDAGLMIIRDLVSGRLRNLIEEIDVVFIPVINPDGFANSSPFHRINQNGPETLGWRTNSLNQNLNRDYTKLDTPEIRGLVKLIRDINPTLYFDIHVTDGADYQYDVTYGWTPRVAYSPSIGFWFEKIYKPYIDADLTSFGHIPGPLVFAKNNKDFSEGILDVTFSPRFSNSWGDARHLPTILVENHSLKPYKQRVLGTYVFLESSLKILAAQGNRLKDMVDTDAKSRPDPVVLSWEFPNVTNDSIYFRGIKPVEKSSELLGIKYTTWAGEKLNETVPVWTNSKPGKTAKRPIEYIIPVQYRNVIQVIEQQGIIFERIEKELKLEVFTYNIINPEAQSDMPFQGRMRIKSEVEQVKKTVMFPVGSIRIKTDQTLGTLACLLMEPENIDSFFQWGFFNDILERTEYFETYAMSPLAEKMAKENPELRAAFLKELKTNKVLSESENLKLRWWYERSNYNDKNYLSYPIGIVY